MAAPLVIVVCGVSGAGKSTVGRLLAGRLGWDFRDADDFHPAANVAKMSRGEPLSDADRAPWLDVLQDLIARALHEDRPLVLACSALKGAYRERLGIDQDRVLSVFLEGGRELIAARVGGRRHDFMPASLLDSQFAALEPPAGGIRVGIDAEPDVIVDRIVAELGRFGVPK
jgi:carbohydrate kinase (thermoresistant glucokinase family)